MELEYHGVIVAPEFDADFPAAAGGHRGRALLAGLRRGAVVGQLAQALHNACEVAATLRPDFLNKAGRGRSVRHAGGPAPATLCGQEVFHQFEAHAVGAERAGYVKQAVGDERAVLARQNDELALLAHVIFPVGQYDAPL